MKIIKRDGVMYFFVLFSSSLVWLVLLLRARVMPFSSGCLYSSNDVFSYSLHSNFCITSECFRKIINSQSHVLFRFRPAMMYVSVPHSLRVANSFARLAFLPSWSTASRWTWKRPATATQRKDGASRPLNRCLNSSQGRFRATKLIGKEIGSTDIFGWFMRTNCLMLGLVLFINYLFHRAQKSDLHQSLSDNVFQLIPVKKLNLFWPPGDLLYQDSASVGSDEQCSVHAAFLYLATSSW